MVSASTEGANGVQRLWQRHEEGVLYAVAAGIYVTAGYFLREAVLNWFIGITFPMVVVYLAPAGIRRLLRRRQP
jgi:hypothetical protein